MLDTMFYLLLESKIAPLRTKEKISPNVKTVSYLGARRALERKMHGVESMFSGQF